MQQLTQQFHEKHNYNIEKQRILGRIRLLIEIILLFTSIFEDLFVHNLVISIWDHCGGDYSFAQWLGFFSSKHSRLQNRYLGLARFLHSLCLMQKAGVVFPSLLGLDELYL